MDDDAVKYEFTQFRLPDNVIFVRPAPWETVVLEPVRKPRATAEMVKRVAAAIDEAYGPGEFIHLWDAEARAAMEAMGYDLPE